MPKHDFIPNIDDANAELIRLDSVFESTTLNLTKATNDLKAANDLLAESQLEVARLKTENGTLSTKVTGIETELKTKGDDVTRLTGELATEKTKATKTIAKAGVVPAKEQASSGDDNLDKHNETKQLTGLQRAIAANTAKLAAKA